MKTVVIKLVGLALMLVGIIFVPHPARVVPVTVGAIVLLGGAWKKENRG